MKTYEELIQEWNDKKLSCEGVHLAKYIYQELSSGGNISLEDYLDAIWIQKQFDDLLVLHANIMNGLKKNPFQPKWLKQRDAIAHDIYALQPALAKVGVKVAKHIEKKYGLELWTMRLQEAAPEKTQMIVSPNEEKQ